MTPRLRPLLGPALMVSLFLLTGCTSGHASTPDHAASPSAGHRGAEARAEKTLTSQARSALDAVTKADDSMVESGMERVSDGVHTEPDLSEGTRYTLTVACAGRGETEIEFLPTGAVPKKAAPCNRSVVVERFTAEGSLRLDVRGAPGSTGMIAWRIDTA